MGCHCIAGRRSKAGMSQCRERERERARDENGGEKKGFNINQLWKLSWYKIFSLFFSSSIFSKCRNCVPVLSPLIFFFFFLPNTQETHKQLSHRHVCVGGSSRHRICVRHGHATQIAKSMLSNINF